MDGVGSRSWASNGVEDFQQLAAKIAAALTAHDLSEALLSIAAAHAASAAVVHLVDREGKLGLRTSRGDAAVPLAAALARGVEIFAETRGELEQFGPAAENIDARLRAGAVLPLLHEGRAMGVFALGFDQERRFADDERHWLIGIAAQAGVAVHRVRLVEDLNRAVRLNELFVGVLAHDLRQPISALTVSAALLEEREGKDDGSDPRGARVRTRILKITARMSRLIDQLLDFSRLRMGAGMPLEPAATELAPLAAQIADEIRADRPDVAVTFAGAGDTRGTWDADRLGQMLSNLIANAVQHRADGAGVRIQVDGTEPESVRVSVHNMGTIAADLVPKLFEPLITSERRRDRASGLGLGLYIAKEIVAAHGGQLTVKSNEIEGTTFTASLPRSGAAAGAQPDPPLVAGTSIAGMNAFEELAKSATPRQPESQLHAPHVPTINGRLHDVRMELELRRLEVDRLRVETQRLLARLRERQGPLRPRRRPSPPRARRVIAETG